MPEEQKPKAKPAKKGPNGKLKDISDDNGIVENAEKLLKKSQLEKEKILKYIQGKI